jgi:hypothetical protein
MLWPAVRAEPAAAQQSRNIKTSAAVPLMNLVCKELHSTSGDPGDVSLSSFSLEVRAGDTHNQPHPERVSIFVEASMSTVVYYQQVIENIEIFQKGAQFIIQLSERPGRWDGPDLRFEMVLVLKDITQFKQLFANKSVTAFPAQEQDMDFSICIPGSIWEKGFIHR